jgi:hypothetical protein
MEAMEEIKGMEVMEGIEAIEEFSFCGEITLLRS